MAMLVEPICVAGQDAATKRGGHEFAVFFFDERTLAGARSSSSFSKSAFTQEVRFFASLCARKELVRSAGPLCDGVEGLPLRSRESVSFPRILFAEPLQGCPQERQSDRVLCGGGVEVGRRG